MPIPKGLSKSPFEINHPNDRWKPDLDPVKDNFQNYYAPFVQNIRKHLYEWRQFGYPDISDTTRELLNFWFCEDHVSQFKYYFGQRESVESVIFLFEKMQIRNPNELLKFDSWGISGDFLKDNWLRLVLKQATGTGKTKVLMLLIAWSYFHKKYEDNSLLSKNFLLICPNTIVLDRLKKDVVGLEVFNKDPIIPNNGYKDKDWYFCPTIHVQDEISAISDQGNIFLTNIQRFANRNTENNEDELANYFLGSKPVTKTLENKIKVKEIVNNLDDLIVLNDEAHHIHEENAWKKAIEDINNAFLQKRKKLNLQIDVTATPKHKKGEIFVQTISDYPLVEAIYQTVVKKPVIPDLPSREKLKEYPSSIFSEKYRDYLNLGYETWLKQFKKHEKLGRKALMFIMVDDTKNCDDVAEYLRSTFPILKNGTFVIHTKDNTKDSTGEISENTAKGREELERLRTLVNTVDDINSPIKVIVSVLMLKEGWDVKNVTTIVGLRAYASHILPEQTLGRGLRKMYLDKDIDEELDVIGTDNFIEYVKGISEEGVELEERAVGGNNPEAGPILIEVDSDNPNKNLAELEIEFPELPKRHGRDYLSLDLLNPETFLFKPIKLKTYSKEEQEKKITFRETIENKEVKIIYFDNLSHINSTSIIRFFTSTILRDLRIANLGLDHFVYEKLKDFLSNYIFGKFVNINEINILRNLSEPDVTQKILGIFKKEINKLTLKDLDFKDLCKKKFISDSQPYLSSRKKIFYHPKKSVFNLISGDSKFEIEFCEYLDSFDDVISFYKNDIQLKQSIEYVKHDGTIGSYFPDFFIKLSNGDRWVVETKGAEGINDPRKIERLKIWCEDATRLHGISWKSLYIRQEIWNGLKPKPINFIELSQYFI